MDSDDEIRVLLFDEIFDVGNGVLEIGFSGVLDENCRGLYRWYHFLFYICLSGLQLVNETF